MLANEWDELVGRDQKSNCVDKSKQSQNDKPRQPIGISERKKLFGEISQIMRRHAKTSNAEHPTSNAE